VRLPLWTVRSNGYTWKVEYSRDEDIPVSTRSFNGSIGFFFHGIGLVSLVDSLGERDLLMH
jgi:hypothetical protein